MRFSLLLFLISDLFLLRKANVERFKLLQCIRNLFKEYDSFKVFLSSFMLFLPRYDFRGGKKLLKAVNVAVL